MIEIDESKLKVMVSSFQIPAKPEILTKLHDAITDEEVQINQVAKIISQDVGLSASILKVINSPAYGLNRQISEIEQAAVFLGLEAIESLATCLMLRASMRGNACISLERFWDDAVDVAEAMRFVGEKVKQKVPVEMLYTVGLFHDCGIPLMAIRYKDYRETLVDSNEEQIPLTKLEMQRYQSSHAVIGYYVAVSWNLPANICNLILRHHDTTYLSRLDDTAEQTAYAVLKVAENIVNTQKRFRPIIEWSQIRESVFEALGITSLDYSDIVDDYATTFAF